MKDFVLKEEELRQESAHLQQQLNRKQNECYMKDDEIEFWKQHAYQLQQSARKQLKTKKETSSSEATVDQQQKTLKLSQQIDENILDLELEEEEDEFNEEGEEGEGERTIQIQLARALSIIKQKDKFIKHLQKELTQVKIKSHETQQQLTNQLQQVNKEMQELKKE